MLAMALSVSLCSWVTRDVGEGWTVAYLVMATAEEPTPQVIAVRVYPSAWGKPGDVPAGGDVSQFPHAGVSAALLSSIRLHDALRLFDEAMLDDVKKLLHVMDVSSVKVTVNKRLGQRAAASAAADKQRRRGRPRVEPAKLARVARLYAEALHRTPPIDPIPHIAAVLGESQSRVRGWVQRARREQYLGGGVVGIARGYETDKVVELLGPPPTGESAPANARKGSASTRKRRK